MTDHQAEYLEFLRISRRDQFQAWLAAMDEILAKLLTSLDSSVAPQLDFTLDSLLVLGQLALAEFGSLETARAEADAMRVSAMSRYVGEVFRRNFGGHWTIDYAESSAFRGAPQIAGMRRQYAGFCPSVLLGALVHRRRADLARSVARGLEPSDN